MVEQLVPEEILLWSEQGPQNLYFHLKAPEVWGVCYSHSSAYLNLYASPMDCDILEGVIPDLSWNTCQCVFILKISIKKKKTFLLLKQLLKKMIVETESSTCFFFPSKLLKYVLDLSAFFRKPLH